MIADDAKAKALFDTTVVAIGSSLPPTDRAALSRAVTLQGGIVALNVNQRVTCVVVVDATDALVKTANDHNVPVVRSQWVTDSIKAAKLKPFSEAVYSLSAASASSSAPAASTSPPASPAGKKRKIEPASAPKTKAKILKKGRAAVDSLCPKAATVRRCLDRSLMHWQLHVYEEGEDVWDCMLNQTNIGQNNNKFYVIQLLQSDDNKGFYVWNRWGRVGAGGQNKLTPCGSSLDDAKNEFCKKFKDKTKNTWENRASFASHPGLYTLIEIDYGSDGDADADADEEEKKKLIEKRRKLQHASGVPESKLSKPVQDLIKLICNVKMMETSLIELEYDIEKMPLGKLKKGTITKAFAVLKELEDALQRNASHGALAEISSRFYTLIPHNFGMRTPPVIGDMKALALKQALLETLGDAEIAANLLKAAEASSTGNPIDANYDTLKACIKAVDPKSETFTMLSNYVQNTHAPTHSTYRLEVTNIFEIEREGEAGSYGKWKDAQNRQLLFHGSRLSNWVGIISQGLRIAPPEAPVTGYMFGKGVYFADMSSKSANYCSTSREHPIGMMILSEVVLGKTHDLTGAAYMDKPPHGCLSTKGCGKTEPDPASTVTLPNGCKVPLGKPVPSVHRASQLLYNEYIVYDTSQVNMKYLLQLKFVYK